MPYSNSSKNDARRDPSRLAGTSSPSGFIMLLELAGFSVLALAELGAGFILLLELAGAGFFLLLELAGACFFLLLELQR